jgi:putative flippase GtrA
VATTTLVSGPVRIRLARFTVASLIATGISQLVLLSVYWVGWSDATAASTLAFLVGSVPHFLLVRYWAWRDTDPVRLRDQLTTYFTVTLISGVASIALTTLAELFLVPLVTGQGWRAVVLTLSYLAAGGPVFLVKFALFDRAFASRTQRSSGPSAADHERLDPVSYADTSSIRVRAANPVAPAVTSS